MVPEHAYRMADHDIRSAACLPDLRGLRRTPLPRRGTVPPHSSAPTSVSWSGAPVDNLWKSATFQANFMT
jgi:hypothetical protein